MKANNKLREALETVRKYVKETTPDKVMLCVIESWCDKALAEPLRNCDVYDAKTAKKEFVRQTGSKSIRSKSVRWLYAPATEKEGGAK